VSAWLRLKNGNSPGKIPYQLGNGPGNIILLSLTIEALNLEMYIRRLK
jgi:hypothetical protein